LFQKFWPPRLFQQLQPKAEVRDVPQAAFRDGRFPAYTRPRLAKLFSKFVSFDSSNHDP
jgi:hypothetical protein